MKRYYAERTDEGIRYLALCVGYDISPELIATWSKDQREAFEIWAERTHLRASDNPVRVPARPAWLPEPWKGPDGGWLWGSSATPIYATVAAPTGDQSP